MSGWAQCPACFSVVTDADGHAGFHDLLARLAEYTAAAPEPQTVEGGALWGAGPVPQVPELSEEDVDTARGLRAQAAQAVAAYQAAMPLLDTYLIATQTTPPTPEDAAVQVRNLTLVARGLVLAVRDLIQLSARTLER